MSFKSLLAPIYLCLIQREIVVPQGDVDIKRCPSKNYSNCDFLCELWASNACMALQPLCNCYLQEELSTKPSWIYPEEDPETCLSLPPGCWPWSSRSCLAGAEDGAVAMMHGPAQESCSPWREHGSPLSITKNKKNKKK